MAIVFHGLTKSQKLWLKNTYSELPIKFFDRQLTSKQLPPKNTTILSVHTESKITKEVLAGLPNLQLIITRTTGTDHINLAACRSAKVKVCNTAGQNAISVAEFSFGLMLAGSRNILSGANQVKSGLFSGQAQYGTELQGQTLGVVGTGAIGAHVLKLGKAFGMQLLGCDYRTNKTLARQLGFRYVSIKEIFRRSDIISLHIPATPLTKHIVNRTLLGLIKSGSGLVNTARGGIVDTKSLLKSLQSGQLGWYASDVLEDELGFSAPNTKNLSQAQKNLRKLNQALVRQPNVITTPHMAHATDQSNLRVLEQTVKLIKQFSAKKPIKVII